MMMKSCVAALTSAFLCAAPARAEEALARGAYLVEHVAVCGDCHTPKEASGRMISSLSLSGGAPMLLGTPNKVVTPNITPDKRTGIGTWTTEQVVAALRNGLRPDGSLIGPPMPIAFYRGISDTDAFAIAAYLETVAPLDHAVPKSVYARPLHSYGPPVEHVADVPTTDKVAYGAYLAGPLAHCLECHTPATNGRPDPSRLGAGGRQFVGPKGAIIVSANLTPDRDQGLGTWTDQNIKDAITKGVRPDGSRLLNFMPFAAFAGLKDSDLDALVAYLRTLKPAKS